MAQFSFISLMYQLSVIIIVVLLSTNLIKNVYSVTIYSAINNFIVKLSLKLTYCTITRCNWVNSLNMKHKLHKKTIYIHTCIICERFKSMCQCGILIHLSDKEMHKQKQSPFKPGEESLCCGITSQWLQRFPLNLQPHKSRDRGSPQDPSSSVSSSSSCCTASSWFSSSSCASFSCSSSGPSLFPSSASRPPSRFSELSKQPESRGWLEFPDLSSTSGSDSASATKTTWIHFYLNQELQ